MFKIQYDCDANFRLVLLGADDKPLAVGEWTTFSSIAVLKYGMRTYIACSNCGTLPQQETAYEIFDRPTQLDNSMEDTYKGAPILNDNEEG